jgi:hypothetical protein
VNVCTRCLYRNEDTAAFCASCGSFLEWSGEKAPEDGSGRAATRPGRTGSGPARRRSPARPPAGGFTRARGRAVPGGDGAEAAPLPAREGADRVEGAEAGDLSAAAEHLLQVVDANRRRRAGLPPREEPPPPTRAAARTRRARPTRPAADGDGDGDGDDRAGGDGDGGGGPLAVRPSELLAAEGPMPEQPTAEVRLPPRQAPVQDDVGAHPGDIVCPRCQTGNAPSRFFCRRCGTSLRDEHAAAAAATAPAAGPRLRWWQRFWRRLLWWRHRGEERLDTAAEPPGLRTRVWAAVPVVLVLALVAGALGPWRSGIGDRIEAARKRLSPEYEEVYPAHAQASSALPDHPPEAAVDRAPNTYWAEGSPTPGPGQTITFRFDRPVDLGRMGFFNGAQAKPQDFLTQPRLREVLIVFDTGRTASLTLKDRDAFQSHEVDAKGVTTVELRIVSVYPSPQGGTDASLGEVEFFTKH